VFISLTNIFFIVFNITKDGYNIAKPSLK